jgi:hypothetical protein
VPQVAGNEQTLPADHNCCDANIHRSDSKFRSLKLRRKRSKLEKAGDIRVENDHARGALHLAAVPAAATEFRHARPALAALR